LQRFTPLCHRGIYLWKMQTWPTRKFDQYTWNKWEYRESIPPPIILTLEAKSVGLQRGLGSAVCWECFFWNSAVRTQVAMESMVG
jgi:hypothetical protein